MVCPCVSDHVHVEPDINGLNVALDPSTAEATFVQSTRTQRFLKDRL